MELFARGDDCGIRATVAVSLSIGATEMGKLSDDVFTVADAIDRLYGTSWAAFVADEISKWCSAYYDEGQASWRTPWREEPIFAA